MYALAEDAGYYGAGPLPPNAWYLVSEAGFNYIDDRCSEYFFSLFRLNRRREAVKSGLSAFGQTSTAVLGATGATTLTMTVVAQAFGLATTMTDVVSGTYLYQLPPATTQAFVKKLQRGYRDAAYRNRASIWTRTQAYRTIQDYLALCLPPTIEAQIVERIARSAGVPDNRKGSIGVRAVSDAEYARMPMVSATERARPAPAPKARRCSPTRYEVGLKRSKIQDIQRTLCIGPNGKLDRQTRKVVYEFFRGYDNASGGIAKLAPDILNCGIQQGHDALLEKAINVSGGVTCSEREYTNAYEVGRDVYVPPKK